MSVQIGYQCHAGDKNLLIILDKNGMKINDVQYFYDGKIFIIIYGDDRVIYGISPQSFRLTTIVSLSN